MPPSVTAKSPYDARHEQQLILALQDPQLADNPLAWVMFAFPWGKPGTPLANHPGPREWQKQTLLRIAQHIAENKRRGLQPTPLDPQVFRQATASGRGIGKSALVCWLVLWMLSTRIGATCIVSANTESQLKSVTWAELGKWATLSINAHWWDGNSARLTPVRWLADLAARDLGVSPDYWYAEAKLWKEENPDAYAGVHNPLGLLLIFDEASGIPAPIWKVAEGFFTDISLWRFWLVFSNPRRTSGAFFECFHKDRLGWTREQIDSRTVEGTDKAVYSDIVTRYGEDSDITRVEVKGQFPRQGDSQFISSESVANAVKRECPQDLGAGLIMAVDVARFGDDRSVIAFRAGRDAKCAPMQTFKSLDTVQLTSRIAGAIARYKPDAVVIDGGGVGGGVVDQVRALGYRVHEFDGGSKAREDTRYANRRAEVWAEMKEWVEQGSLPDDPELLDDILGPEYDFHPTTQKLKIESKERMKDRGLSSPDKADALAMTFAVRVARKDHPGAVRRQPRQAPGTDYSVLG